jgi:lysozyme
MKMSDDGVAFLVGNEERRYLTVPGFLCPPFKDQAGVWTIGIGHVLTSEEIATGYLTLPGDYEVDWHRGVDYRDACTLMRFQLPAYEIGVTQCLGQRPTTQNEFDALVDFAYDVGVAGLRGSSLLHFILTGQLQMVTGAFQLWDKIHDPVSGQLIPDEGLLNRRFAEAGLFFSKPVASAPVTY